MILGNVKKKFGYYQVGEFETFSKVEAIELQKLTGKFPHWIFNQLEFSAYNWSKEPTQTLSELYAKRAQQLRESYDHIVLFYSGGSDSSNILETFVKNNIPFEEIATTDYWNLDPDPTSFFHAEQIQVSFPRIKQLQNQGLKFQHRRIDLSELAVKILNDSTYNINRAYFGNSHWGTNHLAKSYIRETTPDYQQLADKGKKVVFVWGCDKPRLFFENNKFCIKFMDYADTCIPTRTQLVNREWEYDEFFYWAPECADIVCKQGHTLMKFFKQYNSFDQTTYYSESLIEKDLLSKIFNNGITYDGMSHRNLINTLIYPDYILSQFSLGKRPGTIFNPRDLLLHQNPHHSHHIQNLVQHLSKLPKQWHNDSSNMDRGLVGMLSPAYFLE
jgi:hypothetical protein